MDPGSSAFGLVRDDVREGGMAETTAGETGKDPAPPPRSPRPQAKPESRGLFVPRAAAKHAQAMPHAQPVVPVSVKPKTGTQQP